MLAEALVSAATCADAVITPRNTLLPPLHLAALSATLPERTSYRNVPVLRTGKGRTLTVGTLRGNSPVTDGRVYR